MGVGGGEEEQIVFYRNEKVLSDPFHNLRKIKYKVMTRQEKRVGGMFFICRTCKTNEILKLNIQCTALIDIFAISPLYFALHRAKRTWPLDP